MAQKPKEKELGGARQMSTGTKIVIGAFAVIMALSMMLPSLTAIFRHDEATEEQTEETTDSTAETTDDQADSTEKDAESSDKQAEEKKEEEKKEEKAEEKVPDNETLKSLAETNSKEVDKYTERLDKDANNLAALLHLGETYMNWGYSAMNSSTTDEEKDYSKGLLNKGVEYFDRYLALNDSPTVKTDRALCQYYAGDTEGALKALNAVCEEYPENALAWAQLGYLYEVQHDSEKATEAYQKAAELDADDKYGVKSYANRRLIALNSKVSSPSDPGDATVESTSDGQSELMDKLTNEMGSSSSSSGGNVITL